MTIENIARIIDADTLREDEESELPKLDEEQVVPDADVAVVVTVTAVQVDAHVPVTVIPVLAA
jgi:hypothetical protein